MTAMTAMTGKETIKKYQRVMAGMVESFIENASYKSNDEVLRLFKAYNKNWIVRVQKGNKEFGSSFISEALWERTWKVDGYRNYITIPVPKQLPEQEKKELIAMKKELIRLVYIVEEKTEHQRQRREFRYKLAFLIIRIKLWWKSLLKKKEFNCEPLMMFI